MRKLILLLSIFFLLISTTIIKNSTKETEKKIYDTGESLRVLKNKHEMVLLDYNYLTTPEKLLEYQSRYFEDELNQVNILKLKKITLKKNQLKIEEFTNFKKND
tara:strand:- start:93 stop:404 length:312 start_codon:yes stop_codon:yes gene_type:complete